MNLKVNIKNICVVGVLLFIVSSFILRSNSRYFKKNNNNNIYQSSYKINATNFYTNYKREERKIIFQRNILNNAINRNNYIYQSYNKAFVHNISYISNQKSAIRDKISIANSSIKHEIGILDDMINIIYNHHYNYLQFYKTENYSIPEIVYPNNKKKILSINNIETYTSKITKSSVTIGNIFYQGEEDAVGIKNVSSSISAINKLIFLKVNFDYKNIFYYSNNFNNLLFIDQVKKTYNSTNNYNTTKNNQFIITKNKNLQQASKNNPSTILKKNNITKYIKNKPYVVAIPLSGILIIGITGLAIGLSVYIYKKLVQKSHRNVDDMDLFDMNQWIQPILENVAAREDIVDKIHLLDNPEFSEEFFQLLFSKRPPNNSLSFISFKTQILNYLSLEVVSDVYKSLREQNSGMGDDRLERFIWQEIENKRIGGFIWGSVEDIALDRLHKMLWTRYAASYLACYYSTRTTNGWYGIPTFVESMPNSITQDAKNTLNEQLTEFECIIYTLTRNVNHEEYSKLIDLEGNISYFNKTIKIRKIISNEIINDIKEVAEAYRDHINIILSSNVSELGQSRFMSYPSSFENKTVLLKTDFNDVSHLDVSHSDIVNCFRVLERATH